jgi:anaerobic magnesium-protoporphyrin IX monomethyl ester cyclase
LSLIGDLLRILLINPPHLVGDKIPLGYQKTPSVPLGLCYIASTLESKGVTAKIIDMEMGNIGLGEVGQMISDLEPDIVGVTSFTCNHSNAIRIARAVKSCRKEVIVVLGGVHATFMHKEILETVPEIDIVVRFEGEYTMCDIIDALEGGKKLDSVNGITYRDGGKIVVNRLRQPIEYLDELPFPALHLLDPPIESYISKGEKKGLPMLTTRGCPFDCIFCSTTALHGRKYRTRSVGNVIDEIEHLQNKYKVNIISFVDDNFTMQNDRVLDLCNEIKKRNLSIEWGCSTRIDLLSDDLLRTMRSAGCGNIFFGLESASQEVLDAIRKGFSIEKAKEVVKMAEKLGIKTHCSFIIGLPRETVESLNEMVEFVDEVKPSARVLPNILDVLPGTELWASRTEYYANTPDIPVADITRIQLELFFKFYEVNAKTSELQKIAPPDIDLIDEADPYDQEWQIGREQLK